MQGIGINGGSLVAQIVALAVVVALVVLADRVIRTLTRKEPRAPKP